MHVNNAVTSSSSSIEKENATKPQIEAEDEF